jgi:hypothetical protein
MHDKAHIASLEGVGPPYKGLLQLLQLLYKHEKRTPTHALLLRHTLARLVTTWFAGLPQASSFSCLLSRGNEI